MAGGHPWGTCLHLVPGVLTPLLAGRVGESTDIAGVGESSEFDVWGLPRAHFHSPVLGQSSFVLRDGGTPRR
jgi:hypothetical protein